MSGGAPRFADPLSVAERTLHALLAPALELAWRESERWQHSEDSATRGAATQLFHDVTMLHDTRLLAPEFDRAIAFRWFLTRVFVNDLKAAFRTRRGERVLVRAPERRRRFDAAMHLVCTQFKLAYPVYAAGARAS